MSLLALVGGDQASMDTEVKGQSTERFSAVFDDSTHFTLKMCI